MYMYMYVGIIYLTNKAQAQESTLHNKNSKYVQVAMHIIIAKQVHSIIVHGLPTAPTSRKYSGSENRLFLVPEQQLAILLRPHLSLVHLRERRGNQYGRMV